MVVSAMDSEFSSNLDLSLGQSTVLCSNGQATLLS